MIILVNDANILIDLLKIDLLESFINLQYEFHVTDFVVAEVQGANTDQLHDLIDKGVLRKKIFSYDELTEIQLLEVEHRELSIPDCSCLFHAKTLTAQLLTGDAALRRTAELIGVSVHGILWVLDELVEQKIVSRKTAYKKLEKLYSINPRLPEAECKKRIKKWKKE